MKRTRLRKKGKSLSAQVKNRIQKLLRELVISRDGGCVLRNTREAGVCHGRRSDGELILQAEHLNGRANSISYAEPDNLICLCRGHHIFFKKYHSAKYWVIVERILGDKRWKKVKSWILDTSAHHFVLADWLVLEEKLKKEIKKYQKKSVETVKKSSR